MNQNLQELTDKIFREGVEKAEEQSQKILEQAKQKAQQIISVAENKASALISQTEKECADLVKKNETEMRLASQQALASLKQQITDLLIWEMTEGPVKEAFNEREFVQGIIEKLIQNWLSTFGEEERLTVLLPEKDFEDLQKYFRTRGQDILRQGVTIKPSKGMEDGFQIQPEDGRYKVNFTSKDFENYFKIFARPRAYKLLFGED